MATNMSMFKTKGRCKTINGSVLNPENSGLRFVLLPNSIDGKTDDNVLLPVLDKRWSQIKSEMKSWYANKTGEYKYGAIKTQSVLSDTWITHMLCQEGTKVDLVGLEACLVKVSKLALYERASVHIAKELVDAIPELKVLAMKLFVDEGVSTYFYE